MKDRGNRIRIIDILDELLSIKSTGMFLELDIDHFKKINDTYGHQAGDQVILAVADALRSTFRSNDITIRLGGDEFGVFAVGIVDQEMAEALLHRDSPLPRSAACRRAFRPRRGGIRSCADCRGGRTPP